MYWKSSQFIISRCIIAICLGIGMPFLIQNDGGVFCLIWCWLPVLVLDVLHLVEPDQALLLSVVLAFVSSIISSCLLVFGFEMIKFRIKSSGDRSK